MIAHHADASKRIAQHKLAAEFVELIHGVGAAQTAEEQHRQLFSRKTTLADIQQQQSKLGAATYPKRKMDPNVTDPPDSHPSLNKYAPPQDMYTHASNTCTLPASLVYQQPLSKILWSAGLVASKSEGNRLIVNGGVYIGGAADGKRQMGDELSYTPADTKKARWEEVEKFIIKGSNEREGGDDLLILRTGKWRVKIVRVVEDEEFRRRGLSAPPGWEGDGEDEGAREWTPPLGGRGMSGGRSRGGEREGDVRTGYGAR